MKKITTLLLVLLTVLSAGAQNVNLPRALRNAQQNSTTTNTDKKLRFFAGGNINSNFGYYFSLTPEAGIYATNWLRFGVGPRYELSYDNSLMKVIHSFGATAFAEATVVNYLTGRVGYEYLSYPEWTAIDNQGNPIFERRNVHALALGIGFQSYLSNNVRMYALYVIYPVQNDNNYYKKFLPMFARIGVAVDF